MKSKIVITMAGISLVVLSSNILAAACDGVPQYIQLRENATVVSVEMPSPNLAGAIYICNLKSTVGGKNPQQCKSLYAALLSAKLTSSWISIDISNYATCNDVPRWSNGVIADVNSIKVF